VEAAIFLIDITRQFTEDATARDLYQDKISQLHLEFKFAPTEALKALRSQARWCESRSEIQALRDFIVTDLAFSATADETPDEVSVRWEET
jgi:hypothetical protein